MQRWKNIGWKEYNVIVNKLNWWIQKYHHGYWLTVSYKGWINGSQYFISQSITHNYISCSSLPVYINIWMPNHNIISRLGHPFGKPFVVEEQNSSELRANFVVKYFSAWRKQKLRWRWSGDCSLIHMQC